MNEKKRIEKIKNIKNFPMYYQDELGGHRIRYFVDELDLNWLIQQAEKAEQLQERVEELEMKYENTGAIFNRQYMQEKIEQQQQEIRKLQQQLQQAQAKIERCKEIFKDIRDASSDIYALRKAEQALQTLEGEE
jgi:DNA repair exonuclease SbcCD ATPase subunit